MARARSDSAGNRLRLKDVEELYPKSWLGSKPYAGFAREIAAWLWYIDPTRLGSDSANHDTLSVTELWTDKRHDEDETYFELDYELAVTLTNVMEGAGEGHSAQGHSNGAEHWFRSMASAG